MRRWERVGWVRRCGGCGAVLGEGMAVLVISLPDLKKPLLRCENCEGPAPPDLPAHLRPGQSTKAMQPLKNTAVTVARQWMPYKE
jgi:hypothetical protein